MSAKRKSKSSAIIKFIMAVPAIFSLATSVFSVIEYDARQSGKSIGKLFFMCFLSIAVLTATWISLLAMLVVGLIALQWSWFAAFAITFFVNVLMLGCISYCVTRTKKNLLFPVTRKLLRQAISG